MTDSGGADHRNEGLDEKMNW